MDYYDTSQICLNGHTITRNVRSAPELMKKHCPKCGEQTITHCTNCNETIQGEYHVEGVVAVGFSDPPPPNFCHNCGHPYPWTDRVVAAAKELTDEIEELSQDDRENLKKSLDDLYRNTPETELASIRFKKIMAKVGEESYEAMKSILIGILSEAARKSIFGS